MPLLNEVKAVLKKCGKDVAIISYDADKKFIHFTFKDVAEWCSLLCCHIQKHITEKQTCVGLLMTHNILIPSLVIRFYKV